MSPRALLDLPAARRAGVRRGITSVCTAHPLAVEAVLVQGKADGMDVLIEATCNQVNQEGGYTGMTPSGFRAFVEGIADRVGFDRGKLILGGDHLGPNPWKRLPTEEAMRRAEVMIEAYAAAGFVKLHLDTSMGCQGEDAALSDELTAARAARLAARAEEVVARAGLPPPVYVVGTEVPIPGGALEALDHLAVTRSAAALETVEAHRRAFAAAGIEPTFERAIGVVVQPGVEFGSEDVAAYVPSRAAELSAALTRMPQFVFEAHSTDYQPPACLKALVDDGFAILKVGPAVTFALREALYGLDHIADILAPAPGEQGLVASMERLMLDEPDHWRSYYSGRETALRVQRHFSYSDRIRYYWPRPVAKAAVDRLMGRLGGGSIAETLISQYLPRLYDEVRDGSVEPRPHALLIAAVRMALGPYAAACR